VAELSREQLEDFAGQVLWVKRMWDWARLRLAPPGMDSGAEKNATVDCYLLYSRALVEFFRLMRGYPDDVMACDFAPGWTSDVDLTALEATLKSMNKRWGHLSIYRLDEQARKHDEREWIENAHRLLRTWDRFLVSLDAEVSKWFTRELSDAP
jgi:hypothetical protein